MRRFRKTSGLPPRWPAILIVAPALTLSPAPAAAQDMDAPFFPMSPCLLAFCDAAADGPEVASIEMVKPAPANTNLLSPDGPEKRLFGVVPNHRADQQQAIYSPLTTRQKFDIARSDSFDWPNYFLLAGYAVQSQVAEGGFSHNGGTSGFAKFYARSVGDQIIGSYVTEAVMPSLLHHDPRFFRLGTGTFLHRASHAAVSIFVTKTDSGRSTFNLSEVGGNAGVVALTTAYYPDSRTASESVERLSMALGNDVISNLLTEFWPDIKRRLTTQRFRPARFLPQAFLPKRKTAQQ